MDSICIYTITEQKKNKPPRRSGKKKVIFLNNFDILGEWDWIMTHTILIVTANANQL